MGRLVHVYYMYFFYFKRQIKCKNRKIKITSKRKNETKIIKSLKSVQGLSNHVNLLNPQHCDFLVDLKVCFWL